MSKIKSIYKNRFEWIKANPKDYKVARNRGDLDIICDHFGWERPKDTSKNKPNGYWNNKERCIEDARRYETRGEWRLKSKASCMSAKRNGWVDECTAHMIEITKPRGYWNNKERCIEDTKKYKTRGEWRVKSPASCISANKNGWVDECTAHMIEIMKPKGYWNNKDRCMVEAKKYKTRGAWRNGSGSSCLAAKRNGWFEECAAHMIETSKPNGYWNNKERCIEDARKYKTRDKWHKSSNSSYTYANRNGWVDECTAHMIEIMKPRGYWNNKERCIEDARKYKTRDEWHRGSGSSYTAAKKHNWVTECCEHMVSIQNPRGYWNNKERCIEDARKYKTRSEWRLKSSASYLSTKRNGWFDECTKHMK